MFVNINFMYGFIGTRHGLELEEWLCNSHTHVIIVTRHGTEIRRMALRRVIFILQCVSYMGMILSLVKT